MKIRSGSLWRLGQRINILSRRVKAQKTILIVKGRRGGAGFFLSFFIIIIK